MKKQNLTQSAFSFKEKVLVITSVIIFTIFCIKLIAHETADLKADLFNIIQEAGSASLMIPDTHAYVDCSTIEEPALRNQCEIEEAYTPEGINEKVEETNGWEMGEAPQEKTNYLKEFLKKVAGLFYKSDLEKCLEEVETDFEKTSCMGKFGF